MPKRIRLTIVATVASLLASPIGAAPEPRWERIFDGRTMKGWYTYQNKAGKNADNGVFKIENGAFRVLDMPDGATNVEATGCLMTERDFSNVRVRLQYRWGSKNYPIGRLNRIREKKDAGFLYYFFGPDNIWGNNLELQIQQGDDGDLWVNGSASLVTTVADPTVAGPAQWTPGPGTPILVQGNTYEPAPDGQAQFTTITGQKRNVGRYLDWADQGGWNTLEVVMDGQRVEHYVNGHLVFAGSDAKRRDPNKPGQWIPLVSGRICLEAEGAEVWYRNIEVRPLGRERRQK